MQYIMVHDVCSMFISIARSLYCDQEGGEGASGSNTELNMSPPEQSKLVTIQKEA